MNKSYPKWLSLRLKSQKLNKVIMFSMYVLSLIWTIYVLNRIIKVWSARAFCINQPESFVETCISLIFENIFQMILSLIFLILVLLVVYMAVSLEKRYIKYILELRDG